MSLWNFEKTWKWKVKEEKIKWWKTWWKKGETGEKNGRGNWANYTSWFSRKIWSRRFDKRRKWRLMNSGFMKFWSAGDLIFQGIFDE